MSPRHCTTLTLSLFLLTSSRNPNSPYLPWLRLLPVPSSITPLSNLTLGGKNATDLLLCSNPGSISSPCLRKKVTSERHWLKTCYSRIFQPPFLLSCVSSDVVDAVAHVCPFHGCGAKSPVGSKLKICPDHRAPLVSWSSFLWCFVLIKSRMMEFDNGVEGVLPFIDFANHDAEKCNARLMCGGGRWFWNV